MHFVKYSEYHSQNHRQRHLFRSVIIGNAQGDKKEEVGVYVVAFFSQTHGVDIRTLYRREGRYYKHQSDRREPFFVEFETFFHLSILSFLASWNP